MWLAQEQVLGQWDPQIAAIRRGLTTVVPPGLLVALSWRDLEGMVCGDWKIEAAELKKFVTFRSLSTVRAIGDGTWRGVRPYR